MPRRKKQTGATRTENKSKKSGRGRPKSEIPMVRKTYHIPTELADKIDQHAYWSRMTISAVLTDALQQYFQGKKIRPIPKDSKTSVEDFF